MKRIIFKKKTKNKIIKSRLIYKLSDYEMYYEKNYLMYFFLLILV